MVRAFLFFTLLLCACNEPQTAEPPIAEAWRARCGKCHVRVEPKTRTRAQLREAFPRHADRARLTQDEWKQLEDFLASD